MRRNAVLSVSLVVAGLCAAASAQALTVTYQKNPVTYTQTISGKSYIASNYSHCANQKPALRWNKAYWCEKSVGVLTSTQVASINKGSTSTSTPTTGTGSTGTSTGSGSSSGTTTPQVSITYQANPVTYTQAISGVDHVASNYSKCADLKDATRWNKAYWCKKSVGSLTATQVASLTSGSTGSTGSDSTGATGGGTTTPAPTPAPVTYTAKLNWTAPSTRADGKPLSMSELKGYEIYYTSDDLKQSVTLPISGCNTVNYSVANLKAGTYHFAISAIDSKGLKSALSPMVSTTFK